MWKFTRKVGVDSYVNDKSYNDVVEEHIQRTLSRSSSMVSLQAANTAFKKLQHNLGIAFLPKAEHKSGRVMQIIWTIFIGLLSATAILVQVYTDAELADVRSTKSDKILSTLNVIDIVTDISEAIAEEFAIAYENSNTSTDVYLQRSQESTRLVDTKLMWTTDWFDNESLSVIPPELQVNVTSPAALRSAIRAQHDLRKAAVLGVAEIEVINFYSTIIEQLLLMAQQLVLKTPRFIGWQDLMATTSTFQMWISFKKYAFIGKKLITTEGQNIAINDPVFQTLLNYYGQYTNYMSIASMTSSFVNGKMANLSSQDATKIIDKGHNLFFTRLTSSYIDLGSFLDAMQQNEAAVKWILTVLHARTQNDVNNHVNDWQYADFISVPMYAVAGGIAVSLFLIYLSATLRLHSRIKDYYESVKLLKKAGNVIYDFLPKHFILKVRFGGTVPIQRAQDCCVLIIDIANIDDLMNRLEVDHFAELLEDTYANVERCIRKYDCYKIEMAGSFFTLGSGAAGGFPLPDHALALVWLALDLRDTFAEENNQTTTNSDENYFRNIQLRFGVHSGPCITAVLNLQVPRFTIIGNVMQKAAIIHSLALPMKVQTSGVIYTRLLGKSDDLCFVHRGTVVVSSNHLREGTKENIDLFWADWQQEDDDDAATDDGNSNDEQQRQKQQ